jgi:hypothetical protein
MPKKGPKMHRTQHLVNLSTNTNHSAICISCYSDKAIYRWTSLHRAQVCNEHRSAPSKQRKAFSYLSSYFSTFSYFNTSLQLFEQLFNHSVRYLISYSNSQIIEQFKHSIRYLSSYSTIQSDNWAVIQTFSYLSSSNIQSDIWAVQTFSYI